MHIRKPMIRYFFCTIVIVFSWGFSYSQNARIYGNIIDGGGYNSVILAPAVASKLLDSKLETHPKKGYFEFNITVPNACFYRLFYKSKRITLFVKPGANIQMTIENDKVQNYTQFYGDYVQENNLLQLETTPSLGDKQDRDHFRTASQQSIEAYFSAIDLSVKDKLAKWDNLEENMQIDPDFSQLYKDNFIEMASYLYKYYYPKYWSYHQDSFVAADRHFTGFYRDMPSLDRYHFCPLYFDNKLNIIKSKVNQKFANAITSKNTDDLELYKAYIQEAYNERETYVRDVLIENLIGEWVNSYGRTSDLKQEIVEYIERMGDADRKTSLKKRLVSLAQYESGQPAPNFSFEDYAGNKRHSRELIGKIVYIHVWSSNNPASIEEWKAAKSLHAKYKDKSDLIFLFLSIDEDKETWEKTIRANSMLEDIQAISFPGGFNSDFARKYAIQSLPVYILIDKSGNIVSNKLPRPSQSEKIYPLLDKLLGL